MTDTKPTERIKRINKFHSLARQYAESAVIYAAKCGAELILLKKGIDHGQFEALVAKSFEFGKTTAWKYMGLAENIQAKLDSKVHSGELLTTSDAKLLPALREVTDGKTLTQLYLDFGIVKGRETKLEKVRKDLPNPGNLESAENAKHRIDRALDKLEESMAAIFASPDLDDTQANRLTWRCHDALKCLLPDGVVLQVINPISKKPTDLAAYLKDLIGAAKSEAVK